MYEVILLMVIVISVALAYILGLLTAPGEKSIREHEAFLKGKKIGFKKGYEKGFTEGMQYVEQGLLEDGNNAKEI